jgi:hypothetical protein
LRGERVGEHQRVVDHSFVHHHRLVLANHLVREVAGGVSSLVSAALVWRYFGQLVGGVRRVRQSEKLLVTVWLLDARRSDLGIVVQSLQIRIRSLLSMVAENQPLHRPGMGPPRQVNLLDGDHLLRSLSSLTEVGPVQSGAMAVGERRKFRKRVPHLFNLKTCIVSTYVGHHGHVLLHRP